MRKARHYRCPNNDPQPFQCFFTKSHRERPGENGDNPHNAGHGLLMIDLAMTRIYR